MAGLSLPAGTKTYERTVTDLDGGRLAAKHTMVEVEPSTYVNQFAFAKYYAVKGGQIVRGRVEADRSHEAKKRNDTTGKKVA